MFSEPMIAIGSSAVVGQPPWITMTPAQNGRWFWSGTRTLIFSPDPDTPFPYATRYTIRINTAAASLTGHTLGLPYEFDFTLACGSRAPHLVTFFATIGCLATSMLPSVVLMRTTGSDRPCAESTLHRAQLTSDTDILAAAANHTVTLVTTNDLYRCSVIGKK